MLREPFRNLQHHHAVPRKVSQNLWKWTFSQKLSFDEKFRLLTISLEVRFQTRIFSMFASISEDESVIWSCFWCRCKELLLCNLLHTYSITVQCLETFLISFEKKVSLKKHTIVVVCKSVSSKESKFFVRLAFIFWEKLYF